MNATTKQMPQLPPPQIDKLGQWFDVMLYLLCFTGFAGWTFIAIREILTR